jgi:hypothetical protein
MIIIVYVKAWLAFHNTLYLAKWTHLTQVRFTDKSQWEKNDKFKVIEEEWLEGSDKDITLGKVITVYTNLRENYEYRLRFDEAGKFFIQKMELKRKYREAPSLRDIFNYKLDELLN